MKELLVGMLGACVFLVFVAAPTKADDAAAESGLSASWSDGVSFVAPDSPFRVKFGGLFQADWGWIEGDGIDRHLGIRLADDDEIRRARLYAKGQLREGLDFKVQFDFAGPGEKLLDTYLRFGQVPFAGTVTVGRFKEPFGLDQLTGSANTAFLERALPDAFSPSRNWGLMARSASSGERATWALGVFQNIDDRFFGSSGGGKALALTGRVTWLPRYAEDGRRILHLGAAYSLRHPDDPVRYRQRPEAHFTAVLTDTRAFSAEWVHLFGLEAAWVNGPFALQAEYIGAIADASAVGDPYFDGYYVQASYFLTGEHRPYGRRTGVFGRVKPNRSFLSGGGWGAWEIAARYSCIDLSDGGLPASARTLQDIAVGLNWHLNPNVKLMWNYIRSDVDGSDTDDAADIFMMRVQLMF
jgi:phosphate-selective porin OprO/OprP